MHLHPGQMNPAQALAEAAAAFGQWRLDPATRTIARSAGLARILGLPPREDTITLAEHLAHFHPEDRAVHTRRVEAILGPDAVPAPYQCRVRVVRPDGAVRHVIVQGVPERDAAGALRAYYGMILDVTDLALAEQQAQATDALLRGTLDSMDQGLVILDAEQRVRAFNRAACERLALPPEVLRVGATLAEIRQHQQARGDLDAVPPALRAAMESRAEARLPVAFDWPRPDGAVLEVRRSALADGGCVVTFADVTAQRAAARAVEASERRFRLLAENATDIIVWCDLSTARRYVSPAVARVLGYDPESLIGTRPLDFAHPDDAAAYAALLADLTAGRVEEARTAQRYRHRDGGWVWLEISFKLTHDPASGRADGYVATMRDISDRRAAEEALRQTEARHREALDAAQAAILGQIAEGVILTDASGRITLVNEAASAIHGVARLDVAPDAYTESYSLLTLDGQPHPPADLALARAVRGETVTDARWRIRRPDGAEVLAIGSARPLRDRDGAQTGAVLTLRDDTGREAAERSLREGNATLAQRVRERTREADAARELAEAASRAKSEFLASMSHEIRTPLNGVLGYADLLCESEGLAPAARGHAERIRGAGSALLTIVNDVLDFSKIEAGQIAIAPAPFALSDLIEDALAIVRGSAEAKGLGFAATRAPDLPARAVGDRDRLRQILLNLLNNAVKFTRAGRVDLAVARVADPRADAEGAARLRFAVTDTGVGVPADRRDRLFRRFSQGDGSISRDFGGTGLGLAISKSLVELMGGAIGFESAAGRGSTFWFEVSLPVAGAECAADAAPRPAPTRAPRRLLLAEDVPLNQELACAILRAAGHRVDVVGEGAAAVEAAQREAYDLVLMDVQMPGMDGVAATRRIRALAGPRARVPIVAMTANVLAEQVAGFLEAGMDAHVGKPFRRDDLLDTIDRLTLTATPGGIAPTEGVEPEAGGASRVDRAVLDGVMAAVGPERGHGLLVLLAEELEQRFGPAAGPDRAQLALDAHAMISAAGSLGFVELSRACRAVEAACRGSDDIEPRLAALRALTRATVADVRARRIA